MKIVSLTRNVVLAHPITRETFEFKEKDEVIIPDSFVEDLQGQYAKLNLIRTVKDISSKFKEYKGEILNGKLLLVIRYGGIGDLMFITPSVRKLRNLYPDCEIYLLCGDRYQPLFKELGLYDGMLSTPVSMSVLKQKAGFNVNQNNSYYVIFEGLIENSSESRELNAYDLVARRFSLELTPEEIKPEIYLDKELNVELCSKLLQFDTEKLDIGYQFTASAVIRTLRPEKSVEFLNSWDIPNTRFFIMDSFYKKDYVDFYLKEVKNYNIEIINLASEEFTISHAVALIANLDLVIGPDSSLLHIAGALGIPLVGIFSAFPTELRLKYYKKVLGIDINSDCPYTDSVHHSCFEHGTYCSLAKFYGRHYSPCMELFDPKEAIDRIKKFLGEQKII